MDEARHGHGPVTREKLIEAAGAIFAEKGLHGAAIRDITQRAGANIAAVNYYFHDKFELYTLVLRQSYEAVTAAMNAPLTADTPEGRIRQLVSAMLTAALAPTRPGWQRRLLARELLEPTPALDRMHDLMQRPTQQLWGLVQEIRPDLSERRLMLAVSGIVAQSLFHVHHGHLLRRMFPSMREPTIPELIEQVSEFSLAALRGLGANPSEREEERRTDGAAPAARAARGRQRLAAREER